MIRLRFLALSGLVLMLGGCSQPTRSQQTPISAQAHDWSRQVHRQLNDYRVRQGLAPLRYHPGLEQLCLNHSEWLRKKRGSSFLSGTNVSHSGSHYRARAARIEYGMDSWGENVAYVSQTTEDIAAKLIVLWKSSPPHHEAMLGDWTHAACAISVDGDGSIFATMNFGRLRQQP